jgi:predicted transcriptional regulator
MRLDEVLTLTQAELYWPPPTDLCSRIALKRQVGNAFGADLMSDVLRYNVAHGLLITGLVNPQIVRTAEMADVTAILMVRGKKPMTETLEVARQVGIPILGTQLTMFEACGCLYTAGLKAALQHDDMP